MALNDQLRMLYRQVILENAQNPRNRGEIDNADRQTTIYNPSCGDKLHLTLKLSDDQKVIKQIAFEGQGCTISQASASLMTTLMTGKSQDEAIRLSKLFSDLAMGHEHPEEEIDQLKDAKILTSIMEFPARIKCATLAWWGLDRMLLGESKENEND
ncbi:Fe-S cluster assembly sulfur transfer protein SufU [uncultured Lactobacillus sp.]|uniref:Fe-S cluster assembly sulfur transfer protein SufU n=1 Tax=uncultured Lactobacillus sp. TaxID=153152 RepID=UPI002803A71B|nr:SUF system NifU family Fe-S cluster assembly protein [uncultured Lactobacillus sp.]